MGHVHGLMCMVCWSAVCWSWVLTGVLIGVIGVLIGVLIGQMIQSFAFHGDYFFTGSTGDSVRPPISHLSATKSAHLINPPNQPPNQPT